MDKILKEGIFAFHNSTTGTVRTDANFRNHMTGWRRKSLSFERFPQLSWEIIGCNDLYETTNAELTHLFCCLVNLKFNAIVKLFIQT